MTNLVNLCVELLLVSKIRYLTAKGIFVRLHAFIPMSPSSLQAAGNLRRYWVEI